MKIIPTIYTVIAAILAMFCIVTFGYIYQTQQVEKSIGDVLNTSNLIREGERAQKHLLDLETGLRGYLLTGQKAFLEPYEEGQVQLERTFARLDSLTQNNPEQNKLVHLIRQDAHAWITTFATPLVLSKHREMTNSQGKALYDSLFFNSVQQGNGKRIMDNTRQLFDQLKHTEERIKKNRIGQLNASLVRTNEIAVGLTVMSILAGGIMAYLLGKTIRNRFRRMNSLAHSISQGDYSVSLVDTRNDEISSLTQSLNLMASKLQTSFNHLTKMNKELDQFAYVVSHDLKAPLRAINNLAEWISEDLQTNDPDIIKNFSILRGRVQRMENLINGILMYSRVGKQTLPSTTFSVKEMLEETIENLSPPEGFEIRTHGSLPTLTGERTLFYQVLSNLLGNAIKYHHRSSGCIEVSATELDDFYQFEIKDDGPGIPKEYQDKVFGIFQTMEARDVKESTGIGLSIVKKIVEEKGGQIWIKSEKDQGTTFLFTWPKASVPHLNLTPLT
ncbi:sensor histidine kinase [Rufibacter latericius]|uniref:histidine kinase n=1 Tax=Rufibacter latericius TaxID=2487040 RepID=A0A3M9MBD6_9BACT|nr:CHASE3 domain-containing protein [Rufibacter latericius]RNI22467.1 HAMP domain-containing protein [Rufibacter latericius]